VTDDIVDNPIDFYTANTMLNQYPDMRYPLVVSFFLLSQAAVAWLLLGLEDDDTRQCETLKAGILCQHTSFWQALLCRIRNPFIMGFTRIGRAQEPDPSRRVDQQHILDGVVFLLATGVDFLLIVIFWPCYRSLCSLMAKKGVLLDR